MLNPMEQHCRTFLFLEMVNCFLQVTTPFVSVTNDGSTALVVIERIGIVICDYVGVLFLFQLVMNCMP
jgi:hypothetical protein